MATRAQQMAATAMALAAMSLEMIREEPGLAARLAERNAANDVPFPGVIDTDTLQLSEMMVTMMGHAEVSGALLGGHELHIPVPHAEGGTEASASALCTASWAVEFIRKDPEIVSRFRSWVDAKGGGRAEDMGLDDDGLDEADSLLTLMANALIRGVHRHDDDDSDSGTISVPDDYSGWSRV